MMWKLWFVCIIFLLPFVSADRVFLVQGSTEEVFAYGFEFLPAEYPEAPAAESRPFGSAGGGSPFARYYDVFLRVRRPFYFFTERVKGVVDLSLFGDRLSLAPRRDGVLEHYLITPANHSLIASRAIFREGSAREVVRYPLPLNASTGVWAYEVVWSAPGLPPIRSREHFFVIGWGLLVILASLVAGSLYLYRRRKEKTL